MTSHRRHVTLVTFMALALVLVVASTGCDKKESPATSTPAGNSAKATLATAQSALSTMAPDAKLLVVQTAEAVTLTSTPVWVYLFGSPKSNTTYVVYASGDTVMNAAEYGDAGLNEQEWSNVPSTSDWKIDSAEAYTKALAAAGAKDDASSYQMGLQTYVPSAAETSTVRPMTWYVSLAQDGSSTQVIEVDGKTGKAVKSASQ